MLWFSVYAGTNPLRNKSSMTLNSKRDNCIRLTHCDRAVITGDGCEYHEIRRMMAS